MNNLKVVPKLIGVKHLSELISTPAFTIRKWAREGIIPSHKVKGNYLFDHDEVISKIKQF